MKRKLKGFTLIECLVAMAILGVASVTMAQIYASVSKMNLKNHQNNTSISNQEQFIETELKNNGAVEIKYSQPIPATNPPPPSGDNEATKSYIEIEDSSGNTFSYPVDIYVLRSRDGSDRGSDQVGYNGPTETKTYLKYRYFLAHSNP